TYDEVSSGFLNRRGESIRFDIARYEALSEHAAELEETDPLWRPLVVAGEADAPLLAGTWRQYVPAVPLDVAGALYAGLGFLAAAFAALFGRRTLRSRRRRARLQAR
ncbi:MAG: DUF2937 family protein, partial [Pseudomonadota bacterium]